MSQTEYLNTPPMMPPGMAIPGMPPLPEGAPPMPPQQQQQQSLDAVSKVLEQDDLPQIDEPSPTSCNLPVGWLSPTGDIVTNARVRELNGYDEEYLSRLDPLKNVAEFVTELLQRGVESLGGEKPTKERLNQLLLGDRDALVLAIRQATYGNEVDFKLSCTGCGTKSDVYVEIDKDVECTSLEDPRVRSAEVALKHGTAKVLYLNGMMQTSLAATSQGNRTGAETNTLLLSKCVAELNGKTVVMGDTDVMKRLSAADRGTLLDWIAESQPGPRLSDVKVTCGTCGDGYPVTLGLQNLFRF